VARGFRYVHKFSRRPASMLNMTAPFDVMQPGHDARASVTWGQRPDRGTRR
jgi:hypothetical protein